MKFRILAAAVFALAGTVSIAHADEYAGGAVMSAESSSGDILTDAHGMTLYTFDKDAAGMSNCYDECATKWPPLMAAAGASADGEFTLVERKDGSMQWAYKGNPLYLWQNDKQPGDVTGDGVGGVWHIAVE